jgi:hypothetical protein
MAVRLKSRTECPPSGFIVTIPSINQTRQFWSFREAVDWYEGIARANPQLGLPTDPAKIANFIDQQNALRVLAIPGAEIYVMQKGGPELSQPVKKVPLSNLPSRVAAAAADIRTAAAGTAVVLDWLLSGGKPVDPDLASARAAICADCPKNVPGSWFTIAPAETIRATLSARSELKLETPHDAKLQSCAACLCVLKLKVHVPAEYIIAHTNADVWARLDLNCWMLTERAKLQPAPATQEKAVEN